MKNERRFLGINEKELCFTIKSKHVYMVKRFIDNFQDIVLIGTSIRVCANDVADVRLIMRR